MQERLTFTHQAMATTFTLLVSDAEPRYARQAASAVFEELDLIEKCLSRFVEESDISRLNHSATQQSQVVHPHTWQCLRIALDAHHMTGGAFDVAYASAGTAANGPRFALEPRNQVRLLQDGVQLDLGGIGKGYALDGMAVRLAEWDISIALLCASTSTVLAMKVPADEPGWSVHFGPEREPARIQLQQRAFSGSGVAVKGNHIVDPRTRHPAQNCFRAWAAAPTGALADALSTAFMVMEEADIRKLVDQQPGIDGFLLLRPEMNLLSLQSAAGAPRP